MLRNFALVGLLVAAAACQFDQGGVAFDDAPDSGVADDPADQDMAPPTSGADAGAGDECADGSCVCPLPLEDCGTGACVDLLADEDNCGQCGTTCKRDERCEQGTCYRVRIRESCEDCGDGDICEPGPGESVFCIEVGGDGGDG